MKSLTKWLFNKLDQLQSVGLRDQSFVRKINFEIEHLVNGPTNWLDAIQFHWIFFYKINI